VIDISNNLHRKKSKTLSAPSSYSDIMRNAKLILDANWNQNFGITIPAHTLYPYQWSWDSAFIAIGNSYYDIDRSIVELEQLFSAQWKNGMIPHVIFHERCDTYWPVPEYYEIHRSKNSPKHILTSGMTQPPVHAISCFYIYYNSNRLQKRNSASKFLKRIFPKLYSFHKYLLTERDPEKSGLATILHPWESGMDDLPLWDDIILSQIFKERSAELPPFERRDIKSVNNRKGERPLPEIYQVFIYLIDLMKKYDYDECLMYDKLPFKVKDVLFNSIFYIANKALLRIASINDEDSSIRKEIREWLKLQEFGFKKYFTMTTNRNDGQDKEIRNDKYRRNCSSAGIYYDYDVNKKDIIRKVTCASFVPIFTGLLKEEEVRYIVYLINNTNNIICQKNNKGARKDKGHCLEDLFISDKNFDFKVSSNIDKNNYYLQNLVLSYYPLDDQDFHPNRYWRGPIWININWMIYYGLLRYGYKYGAEIIKSGIVNLVKRYGFREYYNPYNGKGLGGRNFSWTAALAIDLLNHTDTSHTALDTLLYA
jgi:hypothetical protein